MEMRYLLSINIMTYLLLYAFYFGYINYLEEYRISHILKK